MAFESANEPLGLTISSVDNNRRTASTGLWLPADSLLADSETFITESYAAYAALTLNRITGAGLLRKYRETTPLNPITAAAESERKLVIVFDVDNGRGIFVQEIPSPVFTIETSNTDEVDLGNPLVAAWVDRVVSGSIGPSNGAVNQYGIQITGARRAFIRHNRSRGR